MSRRTAGVTVVVLLAMVAAACGGSEGDAGDSGDSGDVPPPPTSQRVATATPTSRPSLTVEERTETFVDASRSTDAVGSTPASSNRTLPTAVLTPPPGQPGRPYPLIVFAHGNGGQGRADHLLLRAWAAAGYVVAAPTFPFGAGRAPSGDGANDYQSQPGDMSFVISEMLRVHNDLIDPNRIVAAGHSLGRSTTLALAANSCCHDPRVKAAIVMAGGELPFGRGEFWARVRTPVLFIHGDRDTVVSYFSGRRAYQNTPPPRYLLTVIGGDHGRPFAGGADDQAQVVIATSLDFFDHYLKGVPDGLDRLRADTRAGVAQIEMEQ